MVLRRNRLVVKSFWCDIKISWTANRIKTNIRLIEYRWVFELFEYTHFQIRANIKYTRFPSAKFHLKLKAGSCSHLCYGFHKTSIYCA